MPEMFFLFNFFYFFFFNDTATTEIYTLSLHDALPINPHDPSGLRLLKLVADASRAAGKPASVCGEMASEPLLAFLLIGLGYETLSVAPPALPLVKWTVRQVGAARARAAAEQALAARTAAEVLDLLRLALAEAVDLKLLDPDARLPAGRRAASLNV